MSNTPLVLLLAAGAVLTWVSSGRKNLHVRQDVDDVLSVFSSASSAAPQGQVVRLRDAATPTEHCVRLTICAVAALGTRCHSTGCGAGWPESSIAGVLSVLKCSAAGRMGDVMFQPTRICERACRLPERSARL